MNETPPYEALETELDETLEKLESPGIQLEERLRLHNRATVLYGSLETRLTEARTELERGAPEPPGDPESETYEALSARLERTVEAMEGDDLPLRKSLELRREALLLAARCERILESASGRIRNLDRPEEDRDDAPF